MSVPLFELVAKGEGEEEWARKVAKPDRGLAELCGAQGASRFQNYNSERFSISEEGRRGGGWGDGNGVLSNSVETKFPSGVHSPFLPYTSSVISSIFYGHWNSSYPHPSFRTDSRRWNEHAEMILDLLFSGTKDGPRPSLSTTAFDLSEAGFA